MTGLSEKAVDGITIWLEAHNFREDYKKEPMPWMVKKLMRKYVPEDVLALAVQKLKELCPLNCSGIKKDGCSHYIKISDALKLFGGGKE